MKLDPKMLEMDLMERAELVASIEMRMKDLKRKYDRSFGVKSYRASRCVERLEDSYNRLSELHSRLMRL